MKWMRNAVKREDDGGTHVREHRALEGKKQGATEARLLQDDTTTRGRIVRERRRIDLGLLQGAEKSKRGHILQSITPIPFPLLADFIPIMVY